MHCNLGKNKKDMNVLRKVIQIHCSMRKGFGTVSTSISFMQKKNLVHACSHAHKENARSQTYLLTVFLEVVLWGMGKFYSTLYFYTEQLIFRISKNVIKEKEAAGRLHSSPTYISQTKPGEQDSRYLQNPCACMFGCHFLTSM